MAITGNLGDVSKSALITLRDETVPNEIQERKAADQQLQTKITAEQTAREAADTAFQTALDKKVDKEEGKVLSSNDFTNAYKGKISTLESDVEQMGQSIQTLHDGKVDKDGDKVLSDNNFSDEYKAKLDALGDTENLETKLADITSIQETLTAIGAENFAAEQYTLQDVKNTADTASLHWSELLPRVEALEEDYGPEYRRVTFRGKSLGPSFTEKQKASVSDGSFQDLYLGDYWEIGGHKYRIVDMDYWYGAEDYNVGSVHHLAVMPDDSILTAAMHSSADTSGGYYLAAIRNGGNSEMATEVARAFGENCLSFADYLVNHADDGVPTTTTYGGSGVEIPNARMIYGEAAAYKNELETYSFKQLSLFAVAPRFSVDGGAQKGKWWLRDVADATSFACVNEHGSPEKAAANTKMGVRPVFAIGTRTPEV